MWDEEKELKLKEKYPNLLSDYLFTRGGMSIDQGWYPLIDSLLEKIEEHRNTKDIEFQPIQIKEKFGRLRFYYVGGDQHIDDLVSKAEADSEKICSECSAEKLNSDTTRNGWILSICEDCKRSRFSTK
jgi:hypothetical protein